jgi:ribosomal protein S18 acetylase RimI-like enzyme
MTKTIRKISHEESGQLAALIRGGFLDTAERIGITPENCPHYSAFASDERIAGEMTEESEFYVVDCDGRNAGCVGVEFREPGLAIVKRLAVLPEFRGRGLGNDLLDIAVESARRRGARRVELGVINENPGVREWYMRHGFEVVLEKDPPDRPFTASYMAKDL